MELEYLPIDKSNIKTRPEKFLITLMDFEMLFKISWNVEDNSFYVNIYDGNGNPILLGHKVTYGVDIFGNICNKGVPCQLAIIPLDYSGEDDKITYDNFMENVKPYIFKGDE